MDIRCTHQQQWPSGFEAMQINFVPRASQHCHFDMTFEWSPCPDVSMAGSHSMSDSDRCRWPRSFNPQSISPNTDSISPLLIRAVRQLDSRVPRHCTNCRRRRRVSVQLCAALCAARALRAVASGGRDGFYLGEFGQGLKELGNGPFHDRDLEQAPAEWSRPYEFSLRVDLHTIPPNSQGYLTLGAASLLDGIDLGETDDDRCHLTIEASKVADLIALSLGRSLMVTNFGGHRGGETCLTSMASKIGVRSTDGDTTYLCTAEADGYAVFLSSRMHWLDAGLQNPTRRSICTIEDSVSLSPAIQRYSGQVGAPRIPCRQHLQPVTGSLCRYSARWEEMLSHKFFCRSRPPVSTSTVTRRSTTPPAGLSPDRRVWIDTWDDMSQRGATRGSFAVTWRERLTARGHRIRATRGTNIWTCPRHRS